MREMQHKILKNYQHQEILKSYFFWDVALISLKKYISSHLPYPIHHPNSTSRRLTRTAPSRRM